MEDDSITSVHTTSMTVFFIATAATILGGCVSLFASNAWATSTLGTVRRCRAAGALHTGGIDLPVHLVLTAIAAACYTAIFGALLLVRWRQHDFQRRIVSADDGLNEGASLWLTLVGKRGARIMLLLLVAAGVCDALSNVLWFLSMNGITPAEQAIMQSTIPLFAALLSDRAAVQRPMFGFAVLLTLAGLLVSVSGDHRRIGGLSSERIGSIAVYLASCAIYAAWAAIQKAFLDEWSGVAEDVDRSLPLVGGGGVALHPTALSNATSSVMQAVLLFGDGFFSVATVVTLTFALCVINGLGPVWSIVLATSAAATTGIAACNINESSSGELLAGGLFVSSEVMTYWSLAVLNRHSPMQSSMIVQFAGPAAALVVSLKDGAGQSEVLRQIIACALIAAAAKIERS